MSSINNAQSSGLHAALSILRAARIDTAVGTGAPSATALPVATSEPGDRIDLSKIAQKALQRVADSSGLAESPVLAKFVDSDGKQIGKIYEDGGIHFNTDDLVRVLGGPSPEETAARRQELVDEFQHYMELSPEERKHAEQPRVGQGINVSEYIYGAEYAKFHRDMVASSGADDVVQARLKLLQQYFGDQVGVQYLNRD